MMLRVKMLFLYRLGGVQEVEDLRIPKQLAPTTFTPPYPSAPRVIPWYSFVLVAESTTGP